MGSRIHPFFEMDPNLKELDMDALLDRSDDRSSGSARSAAEDVKRPTRAEAEAAIRTLIRWAGDDPSREGLIETPARVAKAYGEFFSGYGQNPADILSKTFGEVAGYDDMVLLKGIKVQSHCEHHMVPVEGVAHVAYIPNDRVVGLSKLARLVEAYAKRLQTQETMTAQIADAIELHLTARGVAVVIDAIHGCMSCRGVKHDNVFTLTRQFRGEFSDERRERQFWDMVRNSSRR